MSQAVRTLGSETKYWIDCWKVVVLVGAAFGGLGREFSGLDFVDDVVGFRRKLDEVAERYGGWGFG